ncbi:hypothetical protein [Nocardia sp. NBC_01388]|uniref:hypothetical protein n=1 Tax=Nocardia sp. NBC_01388 TaxID=2903596 RepID=UPI00324BAFD0
MSDEPNYAATTNDLDLSGVFPKSRTIDGAWCTVDLLEALQGRDIETAKGVLNDCDAQATALACAALVVILANRDPTPMDEILAGLRTNLPVEGIDSP